MSLMESLASAVIQQADNPQASCGNRYQIGFGSGGGKWKNGLSSSGAGVSVDHYTARQNTRTAMQDSSLCRAMVERMADTVAGAGLRVEFTPNHELLGLTPEEARDWAKDVEARFHLYASDKRQHRSEQLTLYQAQRLYQMFQQRDNDVFVRLYYDRRSGLQNPLQFEFIDPDQIRGDSITTSYGFQCFNDGIERDARGREISYKIWTRKADGTWEETSIPKNRGGRIFMLHGFRPEYAGQGRGFSRLAHAIQEFENITDFSAAAIKKAINQSQIVGFVEPSKDEDASNPFEGILTNEGAGPATIATETTVQETVTDPRPGIDTCYEVPEASMETPGSMFITNLTRGSTIKPLQNSAPGDSFEGFVGSFAGYLSAATSTPLEVVLMKFGNSFSASRATLLLFWRVARGWVAEQDADFMSPFVEMWLSEEIAAGRISAPGWSDPRLRAAWLNKNWIGDPPPDIDPNKTANARKTNIEIGVTNVEREAKDLNGSSAASNIEKNNALFERQGVAPWHSNAPPQIVGDDEED